LISFGIFPNSLGKLMLNCFALRVEEIPVKVRNALDRVDRGLVVAIFVAWAVFTVALVADGLIVPHPVPLPPSAPLAQGWFVVAYAVSFLTVPGSLFTVGWYSPRFPWRPFPGVLIALVTPLAVAYVGYVMSQIWPARHS
jgi:hypothetical protein